MNLFAPSAARRARPGRPNNRRLHVDNLEARIAPAGDVAEFHMLALIYTNVQLPNASATMNQATIDAVTKGIQVELPTMINQLAGDQIQVRVHVEVIDRAFDGLYWNGSNYQWVSNIDQELDEFTRSGWYDHVSVFHALTSSNGPTAWWGGGGLADYGMSVASININRPNGKLGDHDVPGFIHEWIHGLEVQYFYERGVFQGQDPAGNPLDLHDAGGFGYSDITESRPGWSEWYGDFLTDHIRNLQSNGSDTGLGLGPDAWALGVPHDDVAYVPGSPLEYGEVSNRANSFLSDLYWARSNTESGSIQRDATVDNNPIEINGVSYDKGVGIHAPGEILVNLRGRAERFISDIGVVDDLPPGSGSVVFKAYGDGQLIYQSGVLTGSSDAAHVDVDVTGMQQLLLVVEDAGNGNNSDHGVWAGAHFTPFTGRFISDVPWESSSSDWGAIHLDKTVERNDIRINGRHYGKGVGTHAHSEILIPLGDRYEIFRTDVGVDDEVSVAGSIRFEVYIDGQLVESTGTMTPADDAVHIEVDVAGAQELRLVVTDGGNGINSDHGVWAGAHLVNLPPTIDLSGPSSVNEGALYTLNLGNLSNAGSIAVSGYTIHWGDGSSQSFSGNPANSSRTHTYVDGGNSYTITIDLTDEEGTHPNAGSTNVAVTDDPPTIALSGNNTVNEGALYTLNLGAISDPGSGAITGYTIHWGDGDSQSFSGNPANTSRTHTFADGANNYTITVDLAKEDSTHVNTGSKNVTITDVPPTITLSGNATVAEGSLYTLNLGAVGDPGFDFISSYTIHWGDGDTDSFSGDPANASQTHIYADGANDYIIEVDLTNEDGTHVNAGLKNVGVIDVPPTIALTGNSTVDEAALYTLNLGAISDPGSDSVAGFTIHWGDGNTELFSGNPANSSRTHTYAAGGNSYTVAIDLNDEDGTHLTAGSLNVTVINIRPTVTIEKAAGQADPVTTGPILFDVRFREGVTGFDGSDIDFIGSTVGGTLVATVRPVTSANYLVEVTGLFGVGTLVVGIPSEVAVDDAGLLNVASTSIDNAVFYDGYGTITLSAATYAVDESVGSFTVTLTRVGGTDGVVDVKFATSDGTARAGLDYTHATDTRSWDSGQGGERTFDIDINDDSLNEGRETIQIELNIVTGDALQGIVSAELTIAPSDGQGPGQFIDADGDRIRIRLTPRDVGSALIYLTDPDGDGKGPIELVQLFDTDPGRSSLSVTVSKARSTLDNGIVPVGEITGPGMKSLNLWKTSLDGPGINLSGHLGTLSVGNVTKGADIMAAGAPTERTRIRAGTIGNGSTIALGSALSKFTAGSVGASEFVVPSIGTMVIRGNFSGDITVTGPAVLPGSLALRTLNVRGTVTGSEIDVTGNVGRVSVGSFRNSHLFAGYAGGLDGVGRFNLVASIATFRTTARGDAFQNSSVIATTINTAALSSVDGTNNNNRFGIFANTSIKLVTVKSTKNTFKNPISPVGFDDFAVEVV